ncbi:MAG TPA: NADH-quinone oxidoreductase subunit NuoK [Spirochaetia bacterium]|nr:NADH-quinone oxidoreductase subunit NuoK [Spirochaetia bacterium]
MTITLTHYLILGAALFCLGIYGAITRKNAIGILMSLELVFNAVNINLVAAARWQPDGGLRGQLFALFVIAAAAAESVLGLAIILAIYRRRVVVNADEMDLMKN